MTVSIGIEPPDVPFNDLKAADTTAVINDYKDLWESINGPGSWDTNLSVWAISFKRLLTDRQIKQERKMQWDIQHTLLAQLN